MHRYTLGRQAIVFSLFCLLMYSCTRPNRYDDELSSAQSMLADDPEGAITTLESIPEDSLGELQHSKYIYVKTRAYAKTHREITWAEEMHQAALVCEQRLRPYDGITIGDYYYFAGLAYNRSGEVPAAIIDWQKCAEILEKEEPCTRLFSTYENLCYGYLSQMMGEKWEFYSRKMLSAARALNDSVRMIKSMVAISDRMMDRWSFDSLKFLLKEEMSIALALNDSSTLSSAYTGMAALYEKFDSVSAASCYVDSALAYCRDESCYLVAALVRRKEGRISEAVDYYLQSYHKASAGNKYWIARFLNDISKSEPGFENLSTYSDSAIYYNQKIDHDEQSVDIEKAVADYKEQQVKRDFRMLVRSFLYAALFLLFVFGVIYIWKTWKTKRRIEQLELQLQEERAKWLVRDDDAADPAKVLQHRRDLLKLHSELFATTATYRDLLLLRELRTGEMVRAEKREKFITQVLGGFYEPIRPMLDNKLLSHEDLFLCLMTYMNFRSREIAACLGVSDDAVRQRKRRLRTKLEGGEYDMFFSKTSDGD